MLLVRDFLSEDKEGLPASRARHTKRSLRNCEAGRQLDGPRVIYCQRVRKAYVIARDAGFLDDCQDGVAV